MTVAEYLASYLSERGVKRVFEVTGGMITFLLDAIYRHGRTQIVSLHHEQSAAMAADVYGRLTGTPGIALATSGPGAVNLLTGIAGAFFDSSPAVFITGQVNSNEQRGNRLIRQQGFQETEIVSMARAVTKAAWLVEDADAFPDLLARAFALATEGRPGPVLLDIPMDIQLTQIKASKHAMSSQGISDSPPVQSAIGEIHTALTSLASAACPLILVGGGVRAAQAIKLFRTWIKQIGIPVVHSLMGVDVLSSSSKYRVGLIGTNGNRWANMALTESDAILVLGSRLDIRQTGAKTAFFNNKKITHIDCIDAQINNRVSGCTPIVADIRVALTGLTDQSRAIRWPSQEKWMDRILAWKNRCPDYEELQDTKLNPNAIVRAITQAFPHAGVIVTDVGQNQLWTAQSAVIGDDVQFITSGGLGSMGFALPAAISSALDGYETLLFAGDGGFQMNLQELQNVVHHKLPLRMVILNNQCLGMVRQFQNAYLEGRFQSTVWGYSAPDFSRIANAYNIPALTLHRIENLTYCIEWMQKQEGPCLLQVMLDPQTDLFPKVKFGQSLSNMEPAIRLSD